MIITIKIQNRSLSMTAPLGAAAYAIVAEPATIKVLFGMMKPGENGLKALLRIRNTTSTLTWIPVASRPEEQVASAFGKDLYVEYVLIYKDGVWSPSTDAVANFMKAMQGAQAMPATPPSALAASIATYAKKGAAR
jgi:hypothetical protein